MKSNLLDEIAAWPLAARLAVVPDADTWLVVSAGRRAPKAVAARLAKVLGQLSMKASIVRQVGLPRQVAALSAKFTDVPLVLFGLDDFSVWHWRQMDMLRSRLKRSAPGVIVAREATLKRIAASAPNLWSWVATSLWRTIDDPQMLGHEYEE